ncbi:MAG: hypothetical protein ABJH45_14135 [Paracoccaceae bacterium]
MKRNTCDYLGRAGKVDPSGVYKSMGATGETVVKPELPTGARGFSAVLSTRDQAPASETTQSHRLSRRYYSCSKRALFSRVVWHGDVPITAGLYRQWLMRLSLVARRTPMKFGAIYGPNFAKQALRL